MGTYSEDFSSGLPSKFVFDGDNYTISITDKPAEYTHSLQTRVITHGESCEYSLSLTFEQAGQFSFYRRVSSEASYDLFYFYIDGVQKFRISGEGTWAKVTYAVTAGSHIFKWRYTKDVSSSRYSDCGFITGITATNVDTTNHTLVIKCIFEHFEDFYSIRYEQVIRCIGSQVHSLYDARRIQTIKADVTCFTHPFLSGDGTLNNPFTFNKGSQLNEIRNFLSSHFKQVADVDMSGFVDWTPIGYENRDSFTGSYDGGNYKITGLRIEQPPFVFEGYNIPLGLFYLIDTDYFIKDISLKNIDYYGGASAGALAVVLRSGEITNCHSSGLITVEVGASIGGLIGAVVPRRLPTLNIIECSSSVNVEVVYMEWFSSSNFGGLIGMVELIPYDGTSTVNIIKCFATGDVRLQIIPENISEYEPMENFGGLIGSVVEMREI